MLVFFSKHQIFIKSYVVDTNDYGKCKYLSLSDTSSLNCVLSYFQQYFSHIVAPKYLYTICPSCSPDSARALGCFAQENSQIICLDLI